MKRLVLIPLAVAAAIAAIVVAVSSDTAATQTSNTGEVTKFSVRERETSFNFIDNPPAARSQSDLSPGDLVVFTDDFFKGARKVGSDNGVCTVTASTVVECHGSASFRKKGSIELQGAVPVSSFDPGQTLTAAITGGTGVYRSARGVAQAIHINDTTDRMTFRVIR